MDLKIVRGLNYYSGVVFECFTKQLDITRAILGGGVYSNMMESYGYSEHVNCIGFGLGDVVIETVIKELNLFPFENIGIEYVIIPFNDTFFCDACNIATRLREKGKMVDIYIKENKIRSAYSYADRKRADKVLMIAPSEWVNKQIVVKDLRTTDPTKKQITVDLEQYLASL